MEVEGRKESRIREEKTGLARKQDVTSAGIVRDAWLRPLITTIDNYRITATVEWSCPEPSLMRIAIR